jgi:hypothetical protein
MKSIAERFLVYLISGQKIIFFTEKQLAAKWGTPFRRDNKPTP